jgi:hypothetical protein
VRGLEGTIQPSGAHERCAGGQSDERVRVAVRDRQFGDALGIDDLTERGVGRLQHRRLRRDGDLFFRSAQLQRQLDLEPIVDAHFDAFAHQLLEAGELDGDAVGA